MPWFWGRQRKQRAAPADLVAWQATDTALDAANLAVGAETLGVASDTQAAMEQLREDIGDLARRAEPASGTRRVFISSTYLDLKDYRALLHHNLERMYQFAVDMESFGAGGTDATTVSKEEVAASDIFVIIVGWRYGFIPAGATRSITRQEYDEARDLGLPIFVFLADPATEADDGPDALFPASVRDPEHAAQLADFRALLADPDHHTFEFFTTKEDLSAKVVTSLARYVLRTGGGTASGRPDPQGRVVALVDMPRHGRLIGRDEELKHLLERLTAGDDVGIFALAGMGGVGKTALAAEAVTRLAEDATAFPGGVAWIPCTDLTGEDGLGSIVERVARALGLASVTAEPDPQRRRYALAAALASRPPTLLALDNIEPGLDAEAAVQTLATRGHTTVLLTAREHVAEHLLGVIDVPPLPAPDAATLFAERLSQRTDGARPTEAEQADIPPLVEAAGGLPLAVELLAAFAGTQKTALADLRAALKAEGIDAAAFHINPRRTLTKTFDRSWAVLPPRQRALFAGLSLLEGPSFPREAALALALAAARMYAERAQAEGSATSDDAADPESDVAALVGASLVEPLEGGRMRLHQLLHDYAAHQLADPAVMPAEVAEKLGDAVLAYWLAFAQAHKTSGASLNPADMDALEAEAPGLLGALAWAYAHAHWRPLLDLVYALNWTWSMRGRRVEQTWLFPWAVEAAQQGGEIRDQLFMMHHLALLDSQTGRIAEARAGYQEVLRLARELGDLAVIRAETHALAVLDAQQGRVAEAWTGYQEALRLARELGDKRAIRVEMHSLAVRDFAAGHIKEARVGYEEALRLARELGDRDAEQSELLHLADTIGYLAPGNSLQARVLLAEALAISEQLGNPYEIGLNYEFLGRLEEQEGNWGAAITAYRQALQRFVQLESPRADVVRVALKNLGASDAEEAGE